MTPHRSATAISWAAARKGEAMRFAQRIQGLVHNTARNVDDDE